MINPKKLEPFKKFCMTIGEIPTSYLESLTYYETLQWLCNFIEKKVLPAIDNNAEALSELQSKFVLLKEYVDNYFTDLNVQEQINNKLDEMAESGELERVVGDYLSRLDYYIINTTMTQEEIQTILNRERAKIISFTTGEYVFTSTLILNANTKILLNNSILTFDIPSVEEDWTASHGFFNFKRTDTFTEYNGNGNISIIGGKIIGGNCSFCHASNINIKNVIFENCKNDHIIELASINGFTIENCILYGTPLNAGNNKEYIQLESCNNTSFPHFTDSTNITYDDTPCTNINIINNILKVPSSEYYHFVKGIGNHGYVNGVIHTNISIINNEITDMENIGIELYNCKDVIIKNNKMKKTSLTQNLTGAMIRVRYNSENYLIENNIFDGNVYGIETAMSPDKNYNIKIINNIFKNYFYNDNNEPIIRIRGGNELEITRNTFIDFTQNAIRIVDSPSQTDYDKLESNISENTFRPNSNYSTNFIKLYNGVVTCNRNNFDIGSYTTTSPCIITTNSGAFIKLKSMNNFYSEYLISQDKTIQNLEESNGYTDVYGITKVAWSGDSTALTNQELNLPYSQFNRMYIQLIDVNYNQLYEITRFYTRSKLTHETYTFPCYDGEGELGKATLSLNEDGTISFSATNTARIRVISLSNEM